MITLRNCTQKDIPLLANLNQMLITDEKADNSMTLSQLEKRLFDFLQKDYCAFLFEEEGNIVGYALIKENVEPPYLRQFFICRQYRGKGYGREAFHALISQMEIKEIDVDVYSWNPIAISFWKSLGFKERCYNMRLKD